MTLLELSEVYQDHAKLLKLRITQLREARKKQIDPEAVFQLERRITDLEPLLREARELAVLTAHYYDRGYHKNEKYTL